MWNHYQRYEVQTTTFFTCHFFVHLCTVPLKLFFCIYIRKYQSLQCSIVCCEHLYLILVLLSNASHVKQNNHADQPCMLLQLRVDEDY